MARKLREKKSRLKRKIQYIYLVEMMIKMIHTKPKMGNFKPDKHDYE